MDPNRNGDRPVETPQAAERRKPWVAGLLSLLFPGLGHVYNGEPGAALVAWFGLVGNTLLGGLLLARTLAGAAVYVALSLGWYLAVAVHAVVRTRRLGHRRAHWCSRWYALALLAVAVPLGYLKLWMQVGMPAVRYRAYWTASSSMEPTLVKGDRFIVDQWAYCHRGPQRGDVVLFRSPVKQAGGAEWVSRCVALPGDAVAVSGTRLMVNGAPAALPPDAVDDTAFDTGGMAQRYRAQWPQPRILGPGEYVTLGDNRGNSYDGRSWAPSTPGASGARRSTSSGRATARGSDRSSAKGTAGADAR